MNVTTIGRILGRSLGFAAVWLAVALTISACAPPAQPSPTAPAKQQGQPAPTTAPAKAAATPAATSAPAKPAASPAAKAAFDERAVANFYRGKTVRIIVATTAGSLFDAWGRMMARHLPKYLPGNPTMIVENMPGAGHVIGANYLYNQAPKDGTVIGTFVETQVVNQLKGGEGIQFDMAQFNWLGAVTSSNTACLARTDIGAQIRTIQDLLGPSAREAVFATTGPGSDGYEYPMLMKELLGAKIKLVSGYPGNQEVRLAIENGEAEAYCATWDAVRRSVEPWKEAGHPPYAIIVQEGKERHPELKDVPLMHELAQSEEDKLMFHLASGASNYAKPYAAPPGTPPDRVAALRQAFMAVFKDAELIAEAQKGGLDFDPRPGEEVQTAFKSLLDTPKDMVERYKRLVS